MIYDVPGPDAPIRQGDIFHALPFFFLPDLRKMPILEDQTLKYADWDAIQGKETTLGLLPVQSVWGIVASQDCDAARVPYITFFKIGRFADISRLALPPAENHKSWVSILTQKSRLNASWFYLPPADAIGFTERMAATFEEVFMVDREYLETHVGQSRKGRLNEPSYQHFREKASEFFRRYPYDEWYPLNKGEFQEYRKPHDKRGVVIPPFKWQK